MLLMNRGTLSTTKFLALMTIVREKIEKCERAGWFNLPRGRKCNRYLYSYQEIVALYFLFFLSSLFLKEYKTYVHSGWRPEIFLQKYWHSQSKWAVKAKLRETKRKEMDKPLQLLRKKERRRKTLVLSLSIFLFPSLVLCFSTIKDIILSVVFMKALWSNNLIRRCKRERWIDGRGRILSSAAAATASCRWKEN